MKKYGKRILAGLLSAFLLTETVGIPGFINEYPETREILSYIDVLVDGEFIEELKDLSLRFKGSSNQRTIMVQESLKTGSVVLWDPSQGDYDKITV